MRGFETHKGYDMRLVYDAASGEFKWQRMSQQPFSLPTEPSQSNQLKQVGDK